MTDDTTQRFAGLSHAVNDMFSRSREGTRNNTSGKKNEPTTKDLALALTVLLVEVASSDEQFAPEERLVITQGVGRVFGLNPNEVTALINQAKQSLGQYRATDEVATLLKNHIPEAQRIEILELIDQVISADGVTDAFEVYHRHRLAQLLGVDAKPPITPSNDEL